MRPLSPRARSSRPVSNAVGLRHHDVQDEQIEAKILVFVQKREQSSTAAEAMQAAETVGVLPFVFLNSELCELKG